MFSRLADDSNPISSLPSRVIQSLAMAVASAGSATAAASGAAAVMKGAAAVEDVVSSLSSDGIANSVDVGLDMSYVLQSLKKFGAQTLRQSIHTITNDKIFSAFLVIGGGGFIAFATREYFRLRAIRSEMEKSQKKNSGFGTPSSTKQAGDLNAKLDDIAAAAAEQAQKDKKKPKVASGMKLFQQLWRLLKICSPRLFSRFNILLILQFFMLVLRTFLTINCVKNSISTLTEAISRASWKIWVRWFVDFIFWTLGGVIVNSGLRFFESLIALEARRKLTYHAHARYLKGLAFYRATSMQKSVLDNIDTRIVNDIQAFSENIAFLYGHSFKPVLEFVLSLIEASRNLGLKRPVILFIMSAAFNLLLRAVTPQLGVMVAKEAVLEGNFHRAHHRILSNAEEIAFLRGADTERTIVDKRLDALLNLKTEHTVQRIRKSVADNLLKFGSMLTGGVFVHVPFLLARNLSESKRMRTFRATEELMLRCGTSFGEVLLLGRELNELSGYTFRIVELLDALELVEKQEDKEAKEALEALAEADRPKKSGISVQVFGIEDEGDDSELAAQLADTPDCVVDMGPGTKLDPRAGESCWTKDRVPAISFKNVTVTLPEVMGEDSNKPRRVLLKELTMEVEQGKSVLVTGPNGAGKTSLFRVLAGLWPLTSGYITRPSKKPVAPSDLKLAAANKALTYSSNKQQPEKSATPSPSISGLAPPSVSGGGGLRRVASHARTSLRYASSRKLNELAKASELEDSAAAMSAALSTPQIDEQAHARTSDVATGQAGAIMWLPQKPYMVLGTLRDQVTYPVVMGFDTSFDEAILEACDLAGLSKVIESQPDGLDTVYDDWEARLSGGERQKLGFARVFYNRPLFAVLDEATSAVHPDEEARLYATVVTLGITIFSIAHRPALRKYHQLELTFKGDGEGGWDLKKIES